MAIKLTNHPAVDPRTKQEILSDWERFIRGGFVLADLSDITLPEEMND